MRAGAARTLTIGDGRELSEDNRIAAGDTLVSNSGAWRQRASHQYYASKEQAHAFASDVTPMIKHVLGR